jgi:hypothetical protein
MNLIITGADPDHAQSISYLRNLPVASVHLYENKASYSAFMHVKNSYETE